MAGGTLLFVIINEILPETYDVKKSQKAAFAVFWGFYLYDLSECGVGLVNIA